MDKPGANDASHSVESGVAVVLLGRGGIGEAAKVELNALVAGVQQALGARDGSVVAAFVDRVAPSLPEALDALVQAAAARQTAFATIVIVPVFVPDEPALRRWLHKVALRWRASAHAAVPPPRLVFGSPLLQTDGLAALLAGKIDSSKLIADRADETGANWQKDPKAWSEVPAHQHHVLWCTGPRCAAKGALGLWHRLGQVVHQHPVLSKQVMLLQTGCQYPCNHGPLMIVYPEGSWYGRMDEASLAPVLISHVVDGVPNARHCVHQLVIAAPALPSPPSQSAQLAPDDAKQTPPRSPPSLVPSH